MMRPASILLVAAMALTACGSGDGDDDSSATDEPAGATLTGRRQCFNIVGGIETMDYPSTMLIVKERDGQVVSRCTGTFVSDDTMITAAHCVADSETGSMAVLIEDCAAKTFEFVPSLKVFHHGLTDLDFADAQENGELDYDLMALDLAVLLFPPQTAKAYSELASRPGQYGETVTMVGYGIEFTPDDPRSIEAVPFQDIFKRVGTNTLIDPNDGASSDRLFSVFRERALADQHAEGTYATTAQGDSGGPLFLDDALIGVTSSGGVLMTSKGERADQAVFVNLFSETSRSLLETARAGGATFAGYEDYSEFFSSSSP